MGAGAMSLGTELSPRVRDLQSHLDNHFASLHGGSATIDMLERYPRWCALGLPILSASIITEPRSYHAVEVSAIRLRTAVEQPGTCLSCKTTICRG
jgi:hypothetical protein